MGDLIWCDMCTSGVELSDCSMFTYEGHTMLLCGECGRHIRNLIKEYLEE